MRAAFFSYNTDPLSTLRLSLWFEMESLKKLGHGQYCEPLLPLLSPPTTLHPARIRTLIYDYYKPVAEMKGADACPSLQKSLVTISIILIRLMATEIYSTLFYQSNLEVEVLNRLHELANIFLTIGTYANEDLLPNDINIRALLLPMMEQFHTLATKVMSFNNINRYLSALAASLYGLFSGLRKLQTKWHGVFDQGIWDSLITTYGQLYANKIRPVTNTPTYHRDRIRITRKAIDQLSTLIDHLQQRAMPIPPQLTTATSIGFFAQQQQQQQLPTVTTSITDFNSGTFSKRRNNPYAAAVIPEEYREDHDESYSTVLRF